MKRVNQVTRAWCVTMFHKKFEVVQNQNFLLIPWNFPDFMGAKDLWYGKHFRFLLFQKLDVRSISWLANYRQSSPSLGKSPLDKPGQCPRLTLKGNRGLYKQVYVKSEHRRRTGGNRETLPLPSQKVKRVHSQLLHYLHSCILRMIYGALYVTFWSYRLTPAFLAKENIR